MTSPSTRSHFWHRLLSPAHVSRRTGIATLCIAGAWTAGVLLRNRIIHPFCSATPAVCTADRVPFIDRMTLGLEWSMADGISYWIQNFSIVAGPLVILALSVTAARSKRARQFAADGAVWLLSVLVNGALMEWTRITVQRIRPFVYKDPIGLGGPAAHYTSFYSGHTSFVAASWTALVLITLTRTRNAAAHIAVLIAWMVLPVFTGYFRILSGRHFFSDAVVGGLMGVAVATAAAWTQRGRA